MNASSPLLEAARASGDGANSGSILKGLSSKEASDRLTEFGANEVAVSQRRSLFNRLFTNLKNPLVVLLSLLALISLFTGEPRAAAVMTCMVFLGVGLRCFQEWRADDSAQKLKAMVSTTASVLRDSVVQEIAICTVVPGDIIMLSAGDIVPADVRLLIAKDLFVNQSTLTGESMPVQKIVTTQPSSTDTLECLNRCFFGTNIETGTGTAVVEVTGRQTYFGRLVKNTGDKKTVTNFESGINQFTWLMIGLIMIMVPTVFLINGLSKHDWLQAFMFAVAVGVGLTPEMLPAIVTINLSNGALMMSRKKVIVKQLESIQNLGAMDILCTDKTGTLTEGRVVLMKHVDLSGKESPGVLSHAYLNSYFQTGLKNMMDTAILAHEAMPPGNEIQSRYKKIDEIPFDFERRRMSVVLEDRDGKQWLICKGAVEEILSQCTQIDSESVNEPLDETHMASASSLTKSLNEEGFRVLALALIQMPATKTSYEVADECNMTLLGLLAFLDPPKENVSEALNELDKLGVTVKVLTGDSDIVTGRVCRQIGFTNLHILLGTDIDALSTEELRIAVEQTSVFAKLSPSHKQKIIRVLQSNGHVVGFLGDGINDAPALRSADVGISVDTAVDIAKETSHMILLEKNLLVLRDGILEGRRVFGNILKYVKMAASSNFGNMLSVLGASLFLPFLPMLPLQILSNNLLYDFSQTAIPTDNVDECWLLKPQKWDMKEIARFILCMGPVSSIFDYATFFLMLHFFHCWTNQQLFHTGWFVESVLSQTLIIHVIRTNKIPFLQSNASIPLVMSSLTIAAIGAWLPSSPFAGTLGFVPLPLIYWPIVFIFLITYIVLTQLVKNMTVSRSFSRN